MVKGLLGRVKAPPSIFIDGFFFGPSSLADEKKCQIPQFT